LNTESFGGTLKLRWNYSPLKRKGRPVAGWPFRFAGVPISAVTLRILDADGTLTRELRIICCMVLGGVLWWLIRESTREANHVL